MSRQVMDFDNDQLGTLFQKTNDNFEELYDKDAVQDSKIAKKAEQSQVDNLDARVKNLTANNGSQTEGNAELVDIRVGTQGETYETAGDAIRNQLNSIDEKLNDTCVTKIRELLKESNRIENTYYGHGKSSTASVQGFHIYKPIKVIKGVRYYFRHITLYFSCFIDCDGEVTIFTEESSPFTIEEFEFTPNKDGMLYITLTDNAYNDKKFGVSNGEPTWDKYDENNESINITNEPEFRYLGHVYSNNYEELLPDFNECNTTGYYNLTFASGSTDIPLNSPFEDVWKSSNTCQLLVLGNGDGSLGTTQIFISYNIAKRVSNGNSYSSWVVVAERNEDISNKDYFRYLGHAYSNNYKELLPDFNECLIPGYYNMTFTSGSTDIPLNSPFGETWKTNNTCQLLVLGDNNLLGTTQIFIASDSIIKRISNGKSYSSWMIIAERNEIINNTDKNSYPDSIYVDKSGNKDYTRIIDAINYANSKNPTKDKPINIYISTGVYDILEELGGDSFLESITENSGNRNGLQLRGNVNLIGEGSVTLNLIIEDEDSNQYTSEKISVIEVYGNTYLENLRINCKNIRYCIHDETGGSSLYDNTEHYYKNILLHHKGGLTNYWRSHSAFGCGTSGGCIYKFEDSIFISDDFIALGIHNNANQSSIRVTMDGCIFNGGYIFGEDEIAVKFGYYKINSIEDMNQIFIKNCKSNNPISVRKETSSVESTNVWNVNNFTDIEIIIR